MWEKREEDDFSPGDPSTDFRRMAKIPLTRAKIFARKVKNRTRNACDNVDANSTIESSILRPNWSRLLLGYFTRTVYCNSSGIILQSRPKTGNVLKRHGDTRN